MGNEDTYEIIYMSVASIPFRTGELAQLLLQSRKYNSEHAITGMLLFADGQFMQLLEGTRGEVLGLVDRIKLDTRHHAIRILQEGPTASRQFADWSMAFADLASPEIQALPGFSSFLVQQTPTQVWVNDSAQVIRLLRFFKAVMTAPDDSIRRLKSAVFDPKPQADIPAPPPAGAGRP